MQFCSNCGAQNTDTAKFCQKCGQPFSASSAPGPVPPSPAPPVQPGTLSLQTFLHGRYRIVRLVSQGGMGAIYLAQDRNAFDRPCVVKEMLAYYQTPTEKLKAEQDFEREARVLSTLHYDGVPHIFEYFIEGGRYYLVMEYVEGENLEERMADAGGRLSESEVLDYALQLANTLVYLAKQTPPVIHRDIKPANIILDAEQQKLVLVDFGLAKETTGSGLSGAMSMPLGTPGYAPPEQYSGKVDPRTDVYALGATLHHLLTGRDPRNEAPFSFPPVSDLVSGVSTELEELLERMLQPNADQRPQAREVRDTLEALRRPTTLAATPQPFVFRSGVQANDPFDLALLCDSHWEDGIYHLYAGHFEPWLRAYNREDLAVRAETIRRRQGDPSAGLEEFLRAANPTIPLPSLALDTNRVDLGRVEKGDTASSPIRIKNAGRGCLHGRVAAGVGWASVSPQTFSLLAGEETVLSLTVDTGALDEGPLRQSVAEVTSNGGRDVIACALEVTWQPKLALEPENFLHLGDVWEDQRRPVTAPLRLRNDGGGSLRGHIQTSAPWLTLDATSFDLPSGGEITVAVTADPSGLDVQRSRGTIRVTTPSTRAEVTAHVGVRKRWYDTRSRIQQWLAYSPLLLFGYLGQVAPLSLAVLLLLGYPWPGYPWIVALSAVFVLSFGAFHLSRRWVGALDEIEEYYHRGSLADDVPVSTFAPGKIYALALTGGIFGALVGWRYAPLRPGGVAVWVTVTLLAGAITGLWLAMAGKPSPPLPRFLDAPFLRADAVLSPWLEPLRNGPTLDASPLFVLLRSLGLILMGAFFGILLDGIGGHPLRPAGAFLGGLAGVVLASEWQRLPTLRVRWLLGRLRLILTVAGGALLALTALRLLRYGTVWPLIEGYGVLALRYPGLGTLLWEALLLAVGLGGALGGLWVVDGVGLRWPQARRLFGGLQGLLLAVTLPIYVLSAFLLRFAPLPPLVNWTALLLVMTTAVAVAWGLRERRRQVELVLEQARGGWAQGTAQLPSLRASWMNRARAWLQTNTPNGVLKVGATLRRPLGRIKLPAVHPGPRWNPPTLTEMEAASTWPLLLTATVTAVILQRIAAALLAGVVVGLGLLAFYVLLILAGLVGLGLLIRYLKNRP